GVSGPFCATNARGPRIYFAEFSTASLFGKYPGRLGRLEAEAFAAGSMPASSRNSAADISVRRSKSASTRTLSRKNRIRWFAGAGVGHRLSVSEAVLLQDRGIGSIGFCRSGG